MPVGVPAVRRRHRGQEGDGVLAEDRRVFGGDEVVPVLAGLTTWIQGNRSAGGEGRVAGVDGGDALAARQQARRAVRSHPARQGPAAQRDSVVEKDNGSRRGAGAEAGATVAVKVTACPVTEGSTREEELVLVPARMTVGRKFWLPLGRTPLVAWRTRVDAEACRWRVCQPGSRCRCRCRRR